MAPKAPSPKVEFMDIVAPMPFLRSGVPADTFRALRKKVKDDVGIDFLSTCGDMMRSKGFKTNKVGTAKRSRHQCGDAFDYNQDSPNLVVVREDSGGHTFFRTYLKYAKQDGSVGEKKKVTTFNGSTVNAFLYDFTAAAGTLGWHRIPAHDGWKIKGVNYNKMEFWHYQNTEGLSYDDAIKFLYPK